MATVGVDAELIIDGNPFFIRPGTYKMHEPRVRKATVRLDGGEAYVDLGPGKRVWTMVILAVNELTKYDGSSTGFTGQNYRDFIRNSYLNSVGTTVNFIDPLNNLAVAVHIDNYLETVVDLRTQQVMLASGSSPQLSYLVAIELVEA